MSATGPGQGVPGACEQCLRRSWLLGELSASLDYRCNDRDRLIALLTLGDEELIQAVAGRRKGEMKARYALFDPQQLRWAGDVEAVCRHDRRFPRSLAGPGSPPMLNVAGGLERLAGLTAAPVVAIVGSRRATDYGIEMAKCLARGLAACGVTVTSGVTDGIAVAAHAGALEASGRTVSVISGGLDVARPAGRRSLCERLSRSGCAVAELPSGCPTRRWAQAASERTVAGLAGLTVVVEADEGPGELACAKMARALGRQVAAVPGRVTSPSSRGTHALLMGGAHLIRGPQDALELLYGMDAPRPSPQRQSRPELEPGLKATLEQVGAGRDTPEKLTRAGADAWEVLVSLSELELMGLLARGDGGRYVPRDPLARGGSSTG